MATGLLFVDRLALFIRRHIWRRACWRESKYPLPAFLFSAFPLIHLSDYPLIFFSPFHLSAYPLICLSAFLLSAFPLSTFPLWLLAIGYIAWAPSHGPRYKIFVGARGVSLRGAFGLIRGGWQTQTFFPRITIAR